LRQLLELLKLAFANVGSGKTLGPLGYFPDYLGAGGVG
jgi:hypothetical protein